MTPHLTKSRFVAGCQCHDLLWWRVHEPDAHELEPDIALEDLFEQGRQVGTLARSYVPSGLLIDLPYGAVDERVQATRAALSGEAPAIYEASFIAEDVFVSVDILERVNGGFHLVEVKSSSRVKDDHIPDVAIQIYVLGRCGLEVRRAEVMHLNPECRYPDLRNLFIRADVTEPVAEFLPQVPGELEAQRRTIASPSAPGNGLGEHCLTARTCPFHDRCWPQHGPDHVLTLYRLAAAKKWDLLQQGIESIKDLETTKGLGKVAKRQVRSVEAGGRIVGREIGKALAEFEGPLAFLDFETVSLAIPVWDGCGPWAKMPVQFSCHKEKKAGWPEHHAFLAETGEDCREALAQALVEACRGARSIVTYNVSFERACVRGLAEAVPALAAELQDIEHKLVDLLPVVRNYVYDPAFMGSFSLKRVLPALLPDVNYDDLEVADGGTASLWLSRLLFQPDRVAEDDRGPLREQLLAYCKRDTLATMRLLEKLRKLAAENPVR